MIISCSKKLIPLAMLAVSLAGGVYAGETAKPSTPNPGLKYWYPLPKAEHPVERNYDVVVYGGTPAGFSAAIQAKRMGKTAALYVFRRHVGGATSGGLTESDFGSDNRIGGISLELYKTIGKKSRFKPSEAERAFLKMLADADVPVFFEHRLEKVEKNGANISKIVFENGNSVVGKMFVDATYEGDLFAAAGVSYMLGREDNSRFNENFNGTYFSSGSHVFRRQIDPYKVEGDPSSGLIWGISNTKVEKLGAGDKKIQAYCFRMRATNDPALKSPWPKPADYRPEHYEILKRYVGKLPSERWNLRYSFGPVKLNVGDCNNAGPVSIDYVGGNYGWPEGSYAEREKIFQDHINYQMGFMYFLANDESIPAELRARVNSFGLDKSEFTETQYWPHELYVREGRRLLGDYVMTQANCTGEAVAPESVGCGSYQMDSHHVERVIYKGKVANEGGFERGVKKSYPVSYRSIIPNAKECGNVIVPVALSASHVAFGSIRMEPVFMVLGQSAATAAALAIDAGVSLQELPYSKLKARLIQDGQEL